LLLFDLGCLLPGLLDFNDVSLLPVSALWGLSGHVIEDDRLMVSRRCQVQDIRCFDYKTSLWYRASRKLLLGRLIGRVTYSFKLEIPCDEILDLGDSKVEVLV